jgi:hypothetical protein
MVRHVYEKLSSCRVVMAKLIFFSWFAVTFFFKALSEDILGFLDGGGVESAKSSEKNKINVFS